MELKIKSNKMNPSTAYAVQMIYQRYTDPNQAGALKKLTLDTVKLKLSATRRRITVNTIERLLRYGVGTNELEHLSRRLTWGGGILSEYNKERRRKDFIIRELKTRRAYAIEDLERTKKLYIKRQQYLYQKIEDTIRDVSTCRGVKRSINTIIQDEVQREWNEKKESMKSKLRHLTQKWKYKYEQHEEKWNGIAISDKELEEFHKNGEIEEHGLKVSNVNTDPAAYDNIEVTDNQKALLRLPPKFATYGKISEKEMEFEMEVMNCKLRWEARNKRERDNEIWTREWEEEKIEREKLFDTQSNRLSFDMKRVTDIPTCRRIQLPDPEEEDIEVEIRSMTQRMKGVVAEYKREYCDDKGRVKSNNLTEQQKMGLIECKEKVKNNEQVFMMTDKSMKMTVDTPANYRRAMETHVRQDQEINQAEADKIEKTLNGHSVMWARILKIGKGWKQEQRVKSAVMSKNGTIPELYGLRKDHKPVVNGQEAIGPPTRPVCGASRSINGPLSNILSEVLDRISDRIDEEIDTECRNTEEMIAEFERINNNINETNKHQERVVFSTDVKALYPSLEPEQVAKIASQLFIESEMMIDVDDDELALYLALVLETEEVRENNMIDLIKRWKHENQRRGGQRPGITTSEVIGGEAERRKSKFNPPNRKPNTRELRTMVSLALRKGIMAVIKNHMYRFNERIYLQKEGGPIGLQLTGAIARIFMLWWDRKVKEQINNAMADIDFQLHMYMRYVDDCNIVCTALPTNSRLEKGKVVIDHSGNCGNDEPPDKRTAEIIKEIANGICNFIEVEIDYPSAHNYKYMPILDIEVKMENNKVMYRYYRKKIANSMVVHFNSAMPRNMKRTTLSNEVLRILRNTSREAPVEVKTFLLSEFAGRMKDSGYPEKFRKEVIKSGWEGYEKQVSRQETGECPLYRPKGYRKEERSMDKQVKKRAWYKPYDSVLFCPVTPGGVLASRLREITSEVNSRRDMKIKVIERVGTKITTQLKTACNYEARCRSTTECIVHRNGGRGDCNRENVVYKGTCLTCERSGYSSKPDQEERVVPVTQRRSNVKSTYIGETSRSCFVRGAEHRNCLNNPRRPGSGSNAFVKHSELYHDGEEDDVQYKVDVLKSFKKPMERQLWEGVEIQTTDADVKMNSKRDHYQTAVGRMVVTYDI